MRSGLTDARLEAFLRARAADPDPGLAADVMRAIEAKGLRRSTGAAWRGGLTVLAAAVVLVTIAGSAWLLGGQALPFPSATAPALDASPSSAVPSSASPLSSVPALRALGSWVSAGAIPEIWGPNPAAVRLPDGRILAISSHDGDPKVAVFDGRSDAWTESTGAGLVGGGTVRSATTLLDGTVLVTASRAPGGVIGTRFDPRQGTWSAAGILTPDPTRVDYTMTLLSDGRVLASGGETRDATDTGHASDLASLYDPSTNQWTATGHLLERRASATATLLPDGRVLVVGGYATKANGDVIALASSETYDPTTGTWSTTGAMAAPRAMHTATLLQDGSVLVIGGSGGSRSAERWDPRSGTWSGAAALLRPAFEHTATLLLDGRVLVAGGRAFGGGKADSEVEIYDPIADQWSEGAPMGSPRALHVAVLLADGRVLVAGGEKDFLTMNWLGTSELFTPGG